MKTGWLFDFLFLNEVALRENQRTVSAFQSSSESESES